MEQIVSKTKMVISVITSLTLVFILSSSVNSVFASSNFMSYGSIANEDELFTIHDGSIYVNIVHNGNGQFMKVTDIDTNYSIDQAIERFNIHEDTTSFVVEPSIYSETGLVFELDNDLQFQLIGAIEA